MRELNTSIIMDCIRLYSPLSRADLAGRTGLTRSTVSLIINDLIKEGFVQETETRQNRRIGRPGVLLQFNPDGGFAIGVEVGVDFLSVVVTNFVGKVLWRRRLERDEQETQEGTLALAESTISDAMEYGKQLGLRPLGMGVGIPGLVNAKQGTLIYAPNLRWANIPLRQIWSQRFKLPVFVENEANCACLGEFFYGVAHDVQDFIFLKTGVGLGGGIMIDGKLFRGKGGFAGEIGHMTLYEYGQQCSCGRIGCWETFVRPSNILSEICTRLKKGEKSLLSILGSGDSSKITLNDVADAARNQDKLALDVLETVAHHFAVGITNLVHAFNPELVILGGSLVPVNPWLIPVINSALKNDILPPLRNFTRIESSTQGEDACLLGAIALVLDDILREPFNGL